MTLVHKFIAVCQSIDKGILYSSEVYEYIYNGEIEKKLILEIKDDAIQKILYNKSGKLLLNMPFNYWGITVYENDKLINWIDFLNTISKKIDKRYKDRCNRLRDFMIISYKNHNNVLHFGI